MRTNVESGASPYGTSSCQSSGDPPRWQHALPQSTRLLILAGTAAYALACLLVLRTSVPFLLNLDNGEFLPISFYWKNTGILNNLWLNPIGSGIFNWHGFIQQYLVGLLSFRLGWSDVYFGLNLFASLAILAVVYGVWALLLYRLAVRIPATYYNFSGLLAALTLVAASYFCVQETAIEGTALDTFFWSRARASATTILVLMALLCGAAQAIWIIQVVKEHGRSTTNALLLSRSLEEELRLNKRVCADSAALAATPDLQTAMAIRILPPWSVQEEKPPPAECDIYIQVQGQKNLTRPITPPGFALVMDRFNYDPGFIAVRPLNLAFAIFAAK